MWLESLSAQSRGLRETHGWIRGEKGERDRACLASKALIRLHLIPYRRLLVTGTRIADLENQAASTV